MNKNDAAAEVQPTKKVQPAAPFLPPRSCLQASELHG